jgi:hypothetical protein
LCARRAPTSKDEKRCRSRGAFKKTRTLCTAPLFGKPPQHAVVTETKAPPIGASTLRRWTRAVYEHIIEAGILGPSDRCELIEGGITPKIPQNIRHATGVRLAEAGLRSVVESSFLVNSQLPLALGARSESERDVSAVRSGPRDFWTNTRRRPCWSWR